MTAAERAARYRARKRGELPPVTLAPCGTLAAYRRHTRHGEPIDQACRDAYNAEQRRLYQQRHR